MQIISVNQNPVAYSEDLVAGKTLSVKALLSVAWGCQLVTELAAHIMKHGDTWDNADPELIRKCEEKPPWAEIKEERPQSSYSRDAASYGDLMTVAEFREAAAEGHLIDDDGMGHPVKNGKENRAFYVYPSCASLIPKDATHINWYNK